MQTDFRLINHCRQLIARFRDALASEHALLPISILGLITGLLAGGVILLFRLSIELPQSWWLPGGITENFEALSPHLRLLIPIGGALFLGICFDLISRRYIISSGITHVISRLNHYHGILPIKMAVLQFIAGSIALLTGQSAGREGPAVHLGATLGSALGQYWQLPNNSTRILVGCGTAAAIAASFNTPIAGVIFAMEVIMMEYTIAGFTPIILAAVAGTVVSHIYYGAAPAFVIPIAELHSLSELPLLALVGLCAGAFAACFIFIATNSLRFKQHSYTLRFLAAGLVTGTLAYFVPEIMGIGYDTLNLSLLGTIGLGSLIIIAIAKLLATSISAGLGLPIGIIGPSLLIGACIGGVFSHIAVLLVDDPSATSFYVLMGMGASMGAILNAPLAALMAVVELSNNSSVILPGMLTIITATLARSELFHQSSIHRSILASQGLSDSLSPMLQFLQRASVTQTMSREVTFIEQQISLKRLAHLNQEIPRWIVIERDNKELLLISGTELAKLSDLQINEASREDDNIDLLALPLSSIECDKISFRATLAEAWQHMETQKLRALIIDGGQNPDSTIDIAFPLYRGVLLKTDIENYFLKSSS